MKALLMHPERDFVGEFSLPDNAADLTQDLELETLWGAMAAGDPFLFEVAKSALLAGLEETGAIAYRQEALRDCLANPDVVRRLYELTGEALQAERREWRSLSRDSPDAIVRTSVAKLEALVAFLRELRALAVEHASSFSSRAFATMFAIILSELGEEYLAMVEEQLSELHFRAGIVLSAQLGEGNKGTGYVLRRARERSLLERLGLGRSGYSFTIPERDVSGFKALEEIRNKGLVNVAASLGRATEHVIAFFTMLRSEVGFYVGCLNLHGRLTAKGEPVCWPVAQPSGRDVLDADGIYDPCLTLKLAARVVGNGLAADGKALVMITGANQGGKSTLLRGLGVAQLMMQAGMFVCADSFSADIRTDLFTHFKREEDETMTSGKLDEELARMSVIADAIDPGGLLLCNESFAATNELEGSEIAREVIRAMLDAGVKVLFVTHLFELAHGFHEDHRDDALFLRAERHMDGTRTYRLVEGEPLPTSYAADTYRQVFGGDAEAAPVLAQRGSR